MVIRIRHENQMSEVAAAGQRGRDRASGGEIIFAINIAIDHQNRAGAEQRQGLRDAARGFQRFALARIANRNAERAAVAEHGLDLSAEMRVVDHELGDSRPRQPFDGPSDERFAAGA